MHATISVAGGRRPPWRGRRNPSLSEYLGHADPGTPRTYTHLMPSSEARTREAIDQMLRDGLGASDGLTTPTRGPDPRNRRSEPLARLDVVVERELVRGGAEADRVDFVLTLEVDPRLDQVGREDAAVEQVVVVGLERVEYRRQGAGY